MKKIAIIFSILMVLSLSVDASVKPGKSRKKAKKRFSMGQIYAPTAKESVRNTKRHASGIPVKIKM